MCSHVKSHHTHALTRSRNHTVTQSHNHNAFLIERYVVAEWAAAEADVAAGACHSLAQTADGRVFTWGAGTHGQLGHVERSGTLSSFALDDHFFPGPMALPEDE